MTEHLELVKRAKSGDEEAFIRLMESQSDCMYKMAKTILKNEEDCVKLQVKDTGIGIPQKSTDRVFERFYRVDKSRSKQTGGTGLGLAIVKHIVAKHNAKIDLSSELGKGTTITVIFPKNTLQE